ncbi:unnamed protein product [Arctia plantaginis]|uniref:Uncharacterized protein n=1 Tax=Arctia plantaginis TaxID=874455 RepID=A0A8S1A715_ARCPL|nr:unnamed protein product [Arctia plantaginis]
MSLERTPPKSNSGSHPNLTFLADDDPRMNVSSRKRKTPDSEAHMYNELRQELTASLASYRRELRDSFSEFQQNIMTSFEGMLNKQYENIQKLQQDYNAMKTEISDIKQLTIYSMNNPTYFQTCLHRERKV